MNIRVLSFNIHKGVSWRFGKSTLTLIDQELSRHHTDIIFLQEIRGVHFETFYQKVKPHGSYGKNAIYATGHHGNAILSKFPIYYTENIDLSMRSYEKRGLLHSIVNISNNERPLHLLCVHLGLLQRDRIKQLNQILQHVLGKIPQSDPIILGGDFNDWTELASKTLTDSGLKEAFYTSHGQYARTYPAWAPILKLDRIYVRGFHVDYANRLLHAPWRLLSDHLALEVCLSL